MYLLITWISYTSIICLVYSLQETSTEESIFNAGQAQHSSQHQGQTESRVDSDQHGWGGTQQANSTSKPEKKKTNRLRFDAEASVYLIPHFHEYPRWDHHAMWYSRNEFLCMVERNYDEQAHEQLLEDQDEDKGMDDSLTDAEREAAANSKSEATERQANQMGNSPDKPGLAKPPQRTTPQHHHSKQNPVRRLSTVPLRAILSESPRASTEHPLGTPRAMLMARKDVNAQRKAYLSRLGL